MTNAIQNHIKSVKIYNDMIFMAGPSEETDRLLKDPQKLEMARNRITYMKALPKEVTNRTRELFETAGWKDWTPRYGSLEMSKALCFHCFLACRLPISASSSSSSPLVGIWSTLSICQWLCSEAPGRLSKDR